MVNSALQSMFNDSKAMNVATINVAVEMNPSKLVDKLAKEIHSDMLRIASLTGVGAINVESDEILKYLKTLTFLRVSLVNGDQSKALNGYTRLVKHLNVPVMFYQCLIAMGVAIDRDFSIQFNPVYSIDSTDLLSPESMVEISDMMSRLEMNGLKIVKGVPRDPEGELDFMALSHVEEQVLGYKRSHPVYGFLASFFAQKKLSDVTGMMCRVLYGYDSDYELYVTSIYRALSK